MRSPRALAAAVVVLAMCATCAHAVRRVPGPRDLQRLRTQSILNWTPADQRLGYPNIEKIAPTTLVRRASRPLRLPRMDAGLSGLRYQYAGRRRSIDAFMADLNVVGLIVLHDGAVALERYADGHDSRTPWTAFSVVKSVTSLLFGAALRNGHLRSLDEQVAEHLPELRGSAYEGVTIRHLLQMSSGVAWNPDLADKNSDTYRLAPIERSVGFKGLLAFLAAKSRAALPGQRFVYNTAEADLAGAILQRAAGQGLSAYLTAHLWEPFGMEADAHWVVMGGEPLEHGDCCLSATLRDYARIGLLALHDGVAADGTRLLPQGWMAESTRPSPADPGYGYFWWLRKGGGYFASGSFGQHIEVHPATRTVVAIQSYWPAAYSGDLIAHNDAFVAAVIEALR